MGALFEDFYIFKTSSVVSLTIAFPLFGSIGGGVLAVIPWHRNISNSSWFGRVGERQTLRHGARRVTAQ